MKMPVAKFRHPTLFWCGTIIFIRVSPALKQSAPVFELTLISSSADLALNEAQIPYEKRIQRGVGKGGGGGGGGGGRQQTGGATIKKYKN
ncbi:unnamed protein product [Dicrocoelium dendriticum]|nr:unnamed protein product [Dicrocoelium dendriticum]